MREILAEPSVHGRIARLLNHHLGDWVDCHTIEFVAQVSGSQADWRKRLRELRYLGLEVETRRVRRGELTLSQYMLTNWVELPDDPSGVCREYEASRARRNREQTR
jgi:hypothetical protein